MLGNAVYTVTRRSHCNPFCCARCAACLLVGFATPSVIAGERADMLDVYGSEQAISIATGYDEPIVRAPAVATVVEEEEIRAIGATSLDEVIETVAGIHLSTTDATNTISTVRGITSRVLILLNNVPVAQGLFVNAFGQLNNVQINNVERIEIIRGPGSAVYGADAFAGVINIVTKTAGDIDGTEFGARAGSFDTYDGWFLHGGKYGGFDIALSASGRSTNGFGETIEADAQTRFDKLFGTHASLAPSSINVDKDLVDARLDASRGPWTFRAGYFGQLNMGTGVGITGSLDPEGEINREVVNTDLTYHDRYLDALDITAQMSYVNVNSRFELTGFPPGAFGGAFPEGVRQDLGIDEDRVRAELTALWSGWERHWVRIGLGGVFESLDNTEDARNYTVAGGVVIPTGVFAERGGIGDDPLFPDSDRTIFFAYLQDEWSIVPDWSLTTGVRLDEYSDFGATVNPRVGLVWNMDPRLTTKLLYGHAFRPPSFAEQHSNGLYLGLGNSDLEPSTIDMVELAFGYRAIRYRTDLNFFWYTIHDLIELVANPASRNGLAFINGGDQRGYGLEWEFGVDITPNVGLRWNYAYQNASVDDENVNIRFAATHQVYGEANWRFAPQWNLNVNVKSILDRDRPETDPRPPVENYSIVNLTLRRQNIVKQLDLAFSARNLLDEDAREPSDSPASIPFDIPLPGRSFYGELRYRF